MLILLKTFEFMALDVHREGIASGVVMCVFFRDGYTGMSWDLFSGMGREERGSEELALL